MRLVQAVAFESAYEPPKPETETQAPPDRTAWWVAVEDGVIHTCAGVQPIEVRFDGRTAMMGGIGGVASLPQYRRRGGVRECLRAGLNDMFREGYVFSALYPFSRAFYRKFGYEDGGSVCSWTAPFSAIQARDAGGTIRMLMPGDDLSPVLEVYRACAEAWNLSAVETRFFDSMKEQNWMKNRRYLYVWYDDAGVPAGVLLFTKRDRVMDCSPSFELGNCLLFRDAEALSALLCFAGRFAADYDAIRFCVPQGVRADALFREGNAVRRELAYNGMVRVVNVERALELCRCRGEGSVRIAVTDGMIAENNGTWKLSHAPGRANAVARTDEPADVELPVGLFSQLVLGLRAWDDLWLMPAAKLNAPAQALEGVFYSKKCHLLELF